MDLNELNQEEKELIFPREIKYMVNNEIMGDRSQGVKTRSSIQNECRFIAFLSQIEPKNIQDALDDEYWILAMQEELNQFDRNEVWKLVPRPNNHPTIGTKWVFGNKMDENGVVIRNKARLVPKRYN